MSPCVRGLSHNHANFCRHLLEENLLRRVIQFGTREDSAETFRPSKLTRYSTAALLDCEIGVAVGSLRPNEEFYLSVDIDALDPAFAPGVGTPSPFGLHPDIVDKLLGRLLSRGRMIGLDLVEVNPLLDRNDQTVGIAVELLFRILAYAWPRLKAPASRST
jgi:agmatinase